MTIKEFYESINSDYNDAIARMMNEALVSKLIVKYLNDQSFKKLEDALQAKDYKAAFEAAHTLKGVTLNLGFQPLGNAASVITEKLRANDYTDLEKYLENVRVEHNKVILALSKL